MGQEGHSIKRTAAWLRGKLAGPYRRLFPRERPANWGLYRSAVEGKVGLEIGGPSRLWASGHFLPVYRVCDYVDGVNFADRTVWERRIRAGRYRCEGAHRRGRQFIADAVDLVGLEWVYDFILACHVLEHVANPIKALREWMRVLKTSGHLLLAVPHRDGDLPLSRSVTSLDHLVADDRDGITESDLTHVDEIVAANTRLTSQEMIDEYRALLARNFDHRMMHHHSFDPKLVVSVVDHMALQIRAVSLLPPYHIVCLAEKLAGGQRPNNSAFLAQDADYLKNAPFPVDRRCVED